MPREQDQFLDVVDRDTAERRWWDAVRPRPLGSEVVPLGQALGRVLAADVLATVDVPGFDRSNLDGFAVQASDTFGASEHEPVYLRLVAGEIPPGLVPDREVLPGSALAIATGGMIPRGADAVLMVEHTLLEGEQVRVIRPVSPGAGISFAGSDIARGELVLRKGTRLTSRETGVLAAIGRAEVEAHRRPRVAILSTGDEIVEPGSTAGPAMVFDANATLLADAVRELGGEAIPLGIVADRDQAIGEALDRALRCDLVLLSGGTSKGAGDLSYRVLSGRAPGILVHGVALKPGKPICLGMVGAVPVAILPGFPTSAIFTFHELVAPLLRQLAGLPPRRVGTLPARMPTRFNSEIGRTEYLLVNLVEGPEGTNAYPLGKGSGSVTTFSRADGFVVVPRLDEYLEVGHPVEVVPLAQGTGPVDLMAIGSHCIGLDALLGRVSESGFTVKTLWVGSQGGVSAAARGECDLAGVHLLDPQTGEYNRPFVPAGATLVRGYVRMQGIVFRPDDPRFRAGKPLRETLEAVLADPACVMVNRNRGSGTRVVIEQILQGRRPRGYAFEARSHNAVASAVAQGRADWGVAIAPVAALYGLGFDPVRAEHYDFVIPNSRLERPAVRAFRSVLEAPEARGRLAKLGFQVRRDEPRNLGAIVVCGGESRRMGSPKAWLPFGPETMLERVVRLVGSVVGPVVVVAAAGQVLPPLPDFARVVRDPQPGRGPLQGLAAGLAAFDDTVEWVFATATDVPFFEPNWIAGLHALSGGFDLVIPRAEGYLHPLAALYRRRAAAAAIGELLRQDRLRPVFLTESLATRVVEAEELTGIDPELRTLRNLNTPDDYRAALKAAGLEGSALGVAGP